MSSVLPASHSPYPLGSFATRSDAAEQCMALTMTFLPPEEASRVTARASEIQTKALEHFQALYQREFKTLCDFCKSKGAYIPRPWKTDILKQIPKQTLQSFASFFEGEFFRLFHLLQEEDFYRLEELSPPFTCLRGEWLVALEVEKRLRPLRRGDDAFQNATRSLEALKRALGRREDAQLQTAVRSLEEAFLTLNIIADVSFQGVADSLENLLRIHGRREGAVFQNVVLSFEELKEIGRTFIQDHGLVHKALALAQRLPDSERDAFFYSLLRTYLEKDFFDPPTASHIASHIRPKNCEAAREDFDNALCMLIRIYSEKPDCDLRAPCIAFSYISSPPLREVVKFRILECFRAYLKRPDWDPPNALSFASRFSDEYCRNLAFEYLYSAYLKRPNLDLPTAFTLLPKHLNLSMILNELLLAYLAQPNWIPAIALREIVSKFPESEKSAAIDTALIAYLKKPHWVPNTALEILSPLPTENLVRLDGILKILSAYLEKLGWRFDIAKEILSLIPLTDPTRRADGIFAILKAYQNHPNAQRSAAEELASELMTPFTQELARDLISHLP